MRLYDIPEAIRELLDAAVDPETGEISEELEAQIDGLQEEWERKAEYIALLSREAKAEAAAVKLEEQRLQARRRAAENREGRLKAYLHACMIRAGTPKLETARAKIRIQANSQPSIAWTREIDDLPEEYRRVTVEPDLQRAREDLRAGWGLPAGFVVEWGSHVRIA